MARPSLTIWFNSVEIYPREETETICKPIILKSLELKFIPVRGRKLIPPSISPFINHVEIYPREGTETQLHLFDLERGNVEIYPREGTETMGIKTLVY